ncbi:MAG: hypothetical protein WD875_14280 [Pirellulales bacterium]
MAADEAAGASPEGERRADESWLKDARFAPLFGELLAAVVKQYRVEEAAARELLRASLAGSRLSSVVEGAISAGDIRRTRIYKGAAAEAKRHVYHALRRYRTDDGEYDAWIARLREGGAELDRDELAAIVERLVEGHASTRERMAEQRAFNAFVAQSVGQAASLLDVGCGVQPLRFPFQELPDLRLYAAVDANRRSIDAVTAFAAAFATATGNAALRAVCSDLSGGWRPVLAELGMADDAEFDVALMLKLVPVIARQAKELLDVLARTPARRWIVTGSTTGLAKRTSIARREQRVLLRFIADSGRRVCEEFAFGEEFGYVVEPS